MFSLIAAIGKNYELGKRGDLCFRIPADLKFFKETTMGHPILMGQKTWESLPGKLPGREHYVITHHPEQLPNGIHPVTDLARFIEENQDSQENIFVIGGGSIYTQLLPYCRELYLTEIDASDAEADVFFPKLDYNEWNKTVIKKDSYHDLAYAHIRYIRK